MRYWLLALLLLPTPLLADYAGWPPGTTPVLLVSSNSPNTQIVLTMPAVPGKLNYALSIRCSSNGATAAAWATATMAGLAGGTRSVTFRVNEIAPVGAETSIDVGALVDAHFPLPASAVNTAIVATLPALGAGNTLASCNMTGFTAGDPTYPD